MKIGTKSVLFGAHCFFLHPFFVFAAWWKLYGFPYDPRLWVAFFVHDLGYIGKPNMDGEEGELHPHFGANIMHLLFDWPKKTIFKGYVTITEPCFKWHDFTLYHSRFLAKKNGAHFSKLCVADKLAIALTPYWLYLPMVNLTGEINEYMKLSKAREAGGEQKNANMEIDQSSQKKWYLSIQQYMTKWVEEHKDLRPDKWTPENGEKKAVDETGVYK